MTRIFYDTEFLEDGKSISLISIGMVTAEGDELYAVNDELLRTGGRLRGPDSLYQRVTRHRWLMENVVPHLPLRSPGTEKTHGFTGSEGFFHLDPESASVLPLRLIRAQVRDFILSSPDPELWAWYGAFDHVALAWLWGPMIKLPKGVPMWTNDIRTLALMAGPHAQAGAPVQKAGEHHALADARHNMALFRYYGLKVEVGSLRRLVL
jgi:hypothetical protein